MGRNYALLGENVECGDFGDIQMTWDSWYNWLEVRFNDFQGTWASWYERWSHPMRVTDTVLG